MAETTAIQRVGEPDLMTLGKIMAGSGFFQDTRQAGQAIVKIIAGRELGFPAVQSMTGINIIKGKVALSANLIAAAVKRTGKYNYKVTKLTDAECSIDFFEDGKPVGTSKFTIEDAKAAGISSDMYRKFPRNMLFARAVSNGAKWFCADIFGGPVYTPDELGATVDMETGEVVGVVQEPVKQLEAAAEPIEQEEPEVSDANPPTTVPAELKPLIGRIHDHMCELDPEWKVATDADVWLEMNSFAKKKKRACDAAFLNEMAEAYLAKVSKRQTAAA